MREIIEMKLEGGGETGCVFVTSCPEVQELMGKTMEVPSAEVLRPSIQGPMPQSTNASPRPSRLLPWALGLLGAPVFPSSAGDLQSLVVRSPNGTGVFRTCFA